MGFSTGLFHLASDFSQSESSKRQAKWPRWEPQGLFKNLFYWSKIEHLQGCVNFCHTAKWFSYTHTHTHTHTHTYIFFFICFSTMVYPRILNIVSYAIHRYVLLIQSIYTSLYLLTLNFQSIPPTPTPPRQPQVCPQCFQKWPIITSAICYLIKSVLIECGRELHDSINTRRQGSFRAIFGAVFHRAPEQISVKDFISFHL